MEMQENNIRQLRLHFDGLATVEHKLPASLLVQALSKFQRVVHLIAMADEGREVLQRARITREIERRFPLICEVPQKGGYALPITIGGEADQLFDEQACENIAKKTREVIVAIDRSDVKELGNIIPDMFYRRSILEELKAMQPASHSCFFIDIEDCYNQPILNGSTATEKIKTLLMPPTNETSSSDFGYVTGALIEMKFNERRLVMKLLGSNKQLSVTYAEDFEPMLLDNPRELIQIHGNIVWNDDGLPQSISDVDEVVAIDETPLDIHVVEFDTIFLQPKKTLQSEVVFDRESALFQASGPFDIYLCAATRAELEEQLYNELAMLWQEYAKPPSSDLTLDAQELQKELLYAFEEVIRGI
uniref:Uncharacterized protein n=1 Tax=Chlorobium chlorochromatii (strain CaD3) TaxID=340177 RepID=Q3AQR1_CHLCH